MAVDAPAQPAQPRWCLTAAAVVTRPQERLAVALPWTRVEHPDRADN